MRPRSSTVRGSRLGHHWTLDTRSKIPRKEKTMSHESQAFLGCFGFFVLLGAVIITFVSGTWLHWVAGIAAVVVISALLGSK